MVDGNDTVCTRVRSVVTIRSQILWLQTAPSRFAPVMTIALNCNGHLHDDHDDGDHDDDVKDDDHDDDDDDDGDQDDGDLGDGENDDVGDNGDDEGEQVLRPSLCL